MKRFISALTLCTVLLVMLALVLFPRVEAKVDPLKAFLDQPAPRPPNPLVKQRNRSGANAIYNALYGERRGKAPDDDAPIEEIIQYWSGISGGYSTERHSPRPSDAVVGRLYSAIADDPELLLRLLNALPDDQRKAEIVQQRYDHESAGGRLPKGEKTQLKEWLTINSPTHSEELARRAASVREDGEYLTNHEDLLALTRVDYAQAQPIIDKLYADSSKKVPQVLAKWARYRHALQTGSMSDIDTYRSELQAVVEDKSATPAMRDLALDAIVREKEWPGRADWYFSLLGDETLADVRVNGRSFTGLTTMMLMSSDEKYVDKMIELTRSENKTVRTAAVRNLSLRMNTDNIEVLRALLPWLDDAKWAHDYSNARHSYIIRLSSENIPESVPGLIKLLDEKSDAAPRYGANVAANRAPYANANASRYAANLMVPTMEGENYERFPYRMTAIEALARQKDARAAPALRRLLPEVDLYERARVVNAVLACHGFTVQEQLDGLEVVVKGVRSQMEWEDMPIDRNFNTNTASNAANTAANAMANAANAMANAANYYQQAQRQKPLPMTAEELSGYIGQQLRRQPEISDELAVAVVDRIEALEPKDPKTAGAYRRLILSWNNAAINTLLLRDLKRGIADMRTMNRLIGQRTLLREKHSAELADLRTGKGIASGLASCMFESQDENALMIDTDDVNAKVALFGCARLIRAPLPLAKVAAELRSPHPMLKLAAERYLESEDSREARSFIHALYPNDIKVLGAQNCFVPENTSPMFNEYLYFVFQSIGSLDIYGSCAPGPNGPLLAKTERSFVDEMKKDVELLNVYSFDRNHVRVYKDRAVFSWDEDDSRYRERPLDNNELESFKAYLARSNADELTPYVPCAAPYCMAKELLMIDRRGGRRVYFAGFGKALFEEHQFVSGLNGIFKVWKERPSTLKYAMSREIPGLEVVFASDDLTAVTVWKGDGNDIRIVGSIPSVRKSIDDQIANMENVEDEETEIDYEATARKRAEFHEKTLYDGYGWYRIANGTAEGGAAQPPNLDFIPPRDGHAVPPTSDQWKARTQAVEIRASETGLFKVISGKLIPVRQGSYSLPVISPDGRWVLALKSTEDEGYYGGTSLVRIDLATNRELPVVNEQARFVFPVVFIPSLNRALVAANTNEYDVHSESDGPDDVVPDDPKSHQMRFVDLLSGKVFPVTGEVRPLYQQAFRPLQPASKPNEFWAAIPDRSKNETQVGVYNAKTLTFVPNLTVPKIRFNSMQMWVDSTAQRLYFAYRGHILTLLLTKPTEPTKPPPVP